MDTVGIQSDERNNGIDQRRYFIKIDWVCRFDQVI